MKEVILCKYGEVILKGANRSDFEAKMLKQLRQRARRIGNYKIYYSQSTVYIEPLDEDSIENIDEMFYQAKHVFGFVGVSRAFACEKNIDTILEVVKTELAPKLKGYKTFKAESKRSDKRFPMTSPEISNEVGGAVLSSVPGIKVDVRNPDVIVRVEIRENEAFVHAGQEKGAGGIPYGSSGRGLLLLSGGIDSPVAGYMMAKRGVQLEAIHFESYPYTSERAKEKVLDLAKALTNYTMRLRVHVVSLTKIQELLRDNCEEEYFTLMLRRYMMAISLKLAHDYDCEAIITGESLGQVASQTMKAINVTNSMTDIPIFRPLIGMDKEEIVRIARQIGTFETSTLPYEDCCTVFTPRHPKTRPELEKVIEEQNRLPFEELVKEAYETKEIIVVKQFGENKFE
ncbi:MAG: tRNA 4-thiouridine(8) synthase ThiI [Ruminococcaceae bacterium]|nr:tRNA 4-thiouridine(8) synthase ThiI [Oscillospiraceae bacterium]